MTNEEKIPEETNEASANADAVNGEAHGENITREEAASEEAAIQDEGMQTESSAESAASETESADDVETNAGTDAEAADNTAEMNMDDPALDEVYGDDYIDEDEDDNEDAVPIETLVEETEVQDDLQMDWYILKVQVNRETSICDALRRRVSVAGLDQYFDQILVPTEDVREFTKSGKQRIVKRKLYPGYVVVRMAICDESWFLVRETPGIGDFTGAAGKPAPLSQEEIDRILQTTLPSKEEKSDENVKTAIKYKVGDRVRVKEGNFQNYEGDVSNIDERNGRVTVMINIFNRPNPVELDHWQVEEFE